MKALANAIKLIQREAYEKLPPGEYLWVAITPGSGEDNFDDLSSAIEYLREVGIDQVDSWFTSGKTGVTGFMCGDDRIAVYWGDEDANFVKGVSEKEKREIEYDLEGSVDVEADYAQQDVGAVD
jgi:hypothetical protein